MIDESEAEFLERIKTMASETKWTPGPWSLGRNKSDYMQIDGGLSRPQQHIGLAKVVVAFDGDPYPQGEANADLIAAAPELYEALERLLKWVAPIAGDNHDKDREREEMASVEAACSALRKARGES